MCICKCVYVCAQVSVLELLYKKQSSHMLMVCFNLWWLFEIYAFFYLCLHMWPDIHSLHSISFNSCCSKTNQCDDRRMKSNIARPSNDPNCPNYRPCCALLNSSLIHLLTSPRSESKLSLSSLLLLGCLLKCWVSRKDGVKCPTAASVVNWQPLPWLAALAQDRKSESTGLPV